MASFPIPSIRKGSVRHGYYLCDSVYGAQEFYGALVFYGSSEPGDFHEVPKNPRLGKI